SLGIKPRIMKLGQQVTFTFVYVNTSDQDIGISPNYRAYEALDLRLRRLDSTNEGKVIPYFPVCFDADAVERDFRVLKPGQTFTRKHTAKLSSSLPKSAPGAARKPGLYLLFEDSAMELPGAGRYRVTTRHVAR